MEKNRLPMAEYRTMTSENYKEPVDGKYQDATAAILAGIGSELDTNEELSGTSLESELGQEQAQPTTTGSSMTPGVNRTVTDDLDEEETDDPKGDGSDDSNGRGLAIRMKRAQITHTERAQ